MIWKIRLKVQSAVQLFQVPYAVRQIDQSGVEMLAHGIQEEQQGIQVTYKEYIYIYIGLTKQSASSAKS